MYSKFLQDKTNFQGAGGAYYPWSVAVLSGKGNYLAMPLVQNLLIIKKSRQMQTKPEQDGLRAGLAVDMQLWRFLEPESEPCSQTKITAGIMSFTINGLYLTFSNLYGIGMVALLVMFTLFLYPGTASPPFVLNPALADSELAIIYKVQQPQAERFVATAASNASDTGQRPIAAWLQVAQHMKHNLHKIVLLKKMYSLRDRQHRWFARLKHSALI